jgi:hypothetical protein
MKRAHHILGAIICFVAVSGPAQTIVGPVVSEITQSPPNTVPGDLSDNITYTLSMSADAEDPVNDRYGISVGVRINGTLISASSGDISVAGGNCTTVDPQFTDYFICPDVYPGQSIAASYGLALPQGEASIAMDVVWRVLPQSGPPMPDGTISRSVVTSVGNASPVLALDPAPVPPTYPIDVEQTLVIDLSATDPDGDALVFAVGNAPTGSQLTDNGDGTAQFTWTPGVTQSGTYPNVLFSVTDNGTPMLSDSTEVTIVVGEPTPPFLDPIGARHVLEGQLLAINLSASDTYDFPLAFSVSNAPTGSTLTDNRDGTAVWAWTPTFDQSGSYSALFTVTSDAGSDQESIDITVGDVNRRPTLNPIGNRTVAEGQALDMTLSARDPDLDDLAFAASGMPSGAVFTDNGDGTARFTWTPTFEQAGNYPVTFSVTDDGQTDGVPAPLSDSETVTITVGDVPRPPVLAPIGTQQVQEGQPLGFTLSASDPDGGALSFSAQGLPEGASLVDNGNGSAQFLWTPAIGVSGDHTVTFTVTDPGGLSDAETVLITVGEQHPPQLTVVGNPIVNEGATLRLYLEASDPDGGALTLSYDTLPPGSAFVDNGNGTGTLTWTPAIGAQGAYPVTFTVTDQGGLSNAETVLIQVRIQHPPQLTVVGSPVVNEGATLRLYLEASDPDGGSLTLSHDTLPPGSAFVDNGNGTGTLTWTPSIGAHGAYPVTFSVLDSGDPQKGDSAAVTLRVFGYGDVDRDNDVDLQDLDGVLNRLQQTPGQNDPADVDQDGVISVLDARRLTLYCTRPGCASE